MTQHHQPSFDQLMIDIFTTALEGGIGYWSACRSYHWWNAHDDTTDLQGFYAEIVDLEDDNKEYKIDRKVIVRGFEFIHDGNPDEYSWSTEPPPFSVTADTDWDFDAGDADAIVQYGLFGKIVYG